MKNINNKHNKGQALVVILGTIVVAMIFIPSLVFMVQNEAKWTVKQKKSTVAFHAAEAGADRGLWKLKENSSNWTTVALGGDISGYTGTTVYDIYSDTSSAAFDSGQYKVNIFAGPLAGDITIRSIGRDPATTETRAIEIVLSKQSFQGVLNVDGELEWKPNLIVHWGPVIAYGEIEDTPSDWFPRKYSQTRIEGRDTDPTSPNSDSKEYWAFEDLGTPPQVNLAYYKSIAQSSRINPSGAAVNDKVKKATGNDLAVAVPAGSGYFPSTSNNGGIRVLGSYSYRSSTSVIYTDGTMSMANGTFLDVLAVIGEGDVDFNAGSTVYTATVPANAAIEYVKKKEVTAGYTYPGEGFATYNVANCGMHGFLYCGGELENAGGNSILVGAVKVIEELDMNTFTVYYDANVAANVNLTQSDFYQKSWKEVSAAW